LRGGDGHDLLYGAANNDRLAGGEGNDLMDGGGGTDVARYDKDGGGQGVTVNLSAVAHGGVAAGTAIDSHGDTDTLVSIEQVRGTNYGDLLIGGGGVDDLRGRGGDDVLEGGAGNDMPMKAVLVKQAR